MLTLRRTRNFDEWLRNLRDLNARDRIEIRLDRLVRGNPGQTRNLPGGVSELKIDYGPGYRVYFTQRGAELIILLCGGDKTSQAKDIALATRLAKLAQGDDDGA